MSSRCVRGLSFSSPREHSARHGARHIIFMSDSETAASRTLTTLPEDLIMQVLAQLNIADLMRGKRITSQFLQLCRRSSMARSGKCRGLWASASVVWILTTITGSQLRVP